ncbi:hypothetical protein TVAG_163490 [Trichomonas vaginalis G3]|uniref:Uncharacterized protein n=1 Tax=Trichomonas vaginalis (strain ATCC PRA-98 / G3) TaxID=412133 RepID=A2DG26_TRIV3|nr:hypothetical protein TVAGG3_0953430 [Trichomonas vaginalis G3]EAY20653.1 hypothetical protein TVAG_163490 [Trichomonas vaginalis G3]KAI5487374.1 hypothetical protein TVAGG3_0953430 [Trichomonas vaginalis G3]|eukprot:XP_001581639.1 hypothetical protein [Trichomonas vaginalis G3]
MLGLLIHNVASYVKCPTAEALTFSIREESTSNEWTYFYTTHNLNKDTLTFRLYSNSSLQLHVGKGLECPDAKTDALIKLADKVNQKTYKVDSDLGLVNFGVYNPTQGQVSFVVSVEGENPNNHDNNTHVTFTGIYLALCIVLIALFFVHSILARDKVHYQVEVEE